MKIAVINYESGNLGSVVRALQAVSDQAHVYLASTPDEINRADRWVFPGQGAIPQAMTALERSGLIPALRAGLGVKPLLGICVGMQILFDQSEEIAATTQPHNADQRDHHCSLGWLAGSVKKFPPSDDLKIPHMGWSEVAQTHAHPLWRDISDRTRFYFAHSYYCAPLFSPGGSVYETGRTDYGLPYTSAIAMPRVFAVQFHPEKSGHAGLQLLKNFMELDF